MYNTDVPTRAELPTTRQLVRSTILAAFAAILILISVVLPAEYAVDPTGIGRMIGLTQMGEIKAQLAKEAKEDRQRDMRNAPDRRSSLGEVVGQFFVRSAAAQTRSETPRKDEMSVTLKPGQGTEIKMAMKKGAKAHYTWSSTNNVNFDLHGDGNGRSTSYKKGRSIAKDEGVLTAAFDGDHGWFWRNRGKADVTVTLRTSGDYATIKRME